MLSILYSSYFFMLYTKMAFFSIQYMVTSQGSKVHLYRRLDRYTSSDF